MPNLTLSILGEYYIAGNSFRDYGSASLLFVTVILAFYLFKAYILLRLTKIAKKTTTDIDDVIINLVKSIRIRVFVVIAIFVATQSLTLDPFVTQLTSAALIVVLTYQVILAIEVFVDFLANRYSEDQNDSGSVGAMKTIQKIIKFTIWVVGLLFIIQNFGINVTSLVAGLGIGGIAIALAAQNVLGDLFSSLSILFDKPFVPGDTIVVGTTMGKVEKVGIKTTRIRSVEGEEIVVSNQQLTNSQIRNYKRMKQRRSKIIIGVQYETPNAKLKVLPKLLEKIVASHKLASLERVHFTEFGDSSLIFEIVYFAKTKKYSEYLDLKQAINYEIVDVLAKEKIEMAYPTQTLYLKKS